MWSKETRRARYAADPEYRRKCIQASSAYYHQKKAGQPPKSPGARICRWCGEAFPLLNHRQRLCSEACREAHLREYKRRHNEARPKTAKPTNVCLVCFTAFVGRTGHVRKACSPECRQTYRKWYDQERARRRQRTDSLYRERKRAGSAKRHANLEKRAHDNSLGKARRRNRMRDDGEYRERVRIQGQQYRYNQRAMRDDAQILNILQTGGQQHDDNDPAHNQELDHNQQG